MSIDSSPLKLWALMLPLKLVDLLTWPAQLSIDLASRLRGRGPRPWQRGFLARDLRLELDSEVEDAERRAISGGEVIRIAILRALVRRLDAGGSPGPEVIPFLEERLAGLHRLPAPTNRRSARRSLLQGLESATPGSIPPPLLADRRSGSSI